MSRARLRLPAAALATLAVAALGGCVSLLPKQTPAQLYRFGVDGSAPASSAADDAPRVAVVAPPVAVTPAAATDQLLTATGPQAAFIGGARWVSPAAVLWDEAVRRAFAARAVRVRLLTRSELAGGQAFLRLDVPVFEARYPAPETAPTVHVALHALFTHRSGAFSAEHTFTADVPAAENRVAAIVAAYDSAVEQVAAAAVAWADAHVAAAAAEPRVSAMIDAPRGPTVATRITSSTSTSSTRSSPRP